MIAYTDTTSYAVSVLTVFTASGSGSGSHTPKPTNSTTKPTTTSTPPHPASSSSSSPSPTSHHSSSSSNPGAIAGGVIGSLALLSLVSLAFYFLRRFHIRMSLGLRSRRPSSPTPASQPHQQYPPLDADAMLPGPKGDARDPAEMESPPPPAWSARASSSQQTTTSLMMGGGLGRYSDYNYNYHYEPVRMSVNNQREGGGGEEGELVELEGRDNKGEKENGAGGGGTTSTAAGGGGMEMYRDNKEEPVSPSEVGGTDTVVSETAGTLGTGTGTMRGSEGVSEMSSEAGERGRR
ncbi:MAG: hypothetical protein Q9227_009217 [Pyrenula ochraceoflavens]